MTEPVVLPMIERRRTEAEMLKEVYDTLKASHGVETAKATIAEAVPIAGAAALANPQARAARAAQAIAARVG